MLLNSIRLNTLLVKKYRIILALSLILNPKDLVLFNRPLHSILDQGPIAKAYNSYKDLTDSSLNSKEFLQPFITI